MKGHLMKKGKDMEKANVSTLMGQLMKAIGLITQGMDKEFSLKTMEQFIRDILKAIRKMERENFTYQMVKLLKLHGQMIKSMAEVLSFRKIKRDTEQYFIMIWK